jgi:hypothetical protein
MAQVQFLTRARLCVVLIVALAFAQVGAVQHQYAHGSSGEVCSDCLSFAPLLAAAGGKVHLPAVVRVQAGTRYQSPVAPLFGQPSQHAFRSRAPPSPLPIR